MPRTRALDVAVILLACVTLAQAKVFWPGWFFNVSNIGNYAQNATSRLTNTTDLIVVFNVSVEVVGRLGGPRKPRSGRRRPSGRGSACPGVAALAESGPGTGGSPWPRVLEDGPCRACPCLRGP